MRAQKEVVNREQGIGAGEARRAEVGGAEEDALKYGGNRETNEGVR